MWIEADRSVRPTLVGGTPVHYLSIFFCFQVLYPRWLLFFLLFLLLRCLLFWLLLLRCWRLPLGRRWRSAFLRTLARWRRWPCGRFVPRWRGTIGLGPCGFGTIVGLRRGRPVRLGCGRSAFRPVALWRTIVRLRPIWFRGRRATWFRTIVWLRRRRMVRLGPIRLRAIGPVANRSPSPAPSLRSRLGVLPLAWPVKAAANWSCGANFLTGTSLPRRNPRASRHSG